MSLKKVDQTILKKSEQNQCECELLSTDSTNDPNVGFELKPGVNSLTRGATTL